SLFDGSGGTMFFGSGDANAAVIGPVDGDMTLAGLISAGSGADFGTGGSPGGSPGPGRTPPGAADVGREDGAGGSILPRGGSITLSGPLRSEGTSPTGPGGFVDVTSGLASSAGLSVTNDIAAFGGAGAGFGQSISLVGCTLTVNPSVHVDGHGGVSAVNGALG